MLALQQSHTKISISPTSNINVESHMEQALIIHYSSYFTSQVWLSYHIVITPSSHFTFRISPSYYFQTVFKYIKSLFMHVMCI